MKKIAVLVLVLIAIFAISSSADVDTGFSCSLDCNSLSQNGDSYYCNPDTQTCFLVKTLPAEPSAPDATATAAVTPTPTVSTTDEKITALEGKMATLENALAT